MDFKRPERCQRGVSLCKQAVGLIFACVLFANCTTSSDLQWKQAEHYRWAELSPGYFGSHGFKQLPASRTHIDFKNRITEEEIDENQHVLNGSGVAAGDVDGDGLVDLYFAGLNGPNKLYKNVGGMRFEDVTDKAGVAHEGYYSTGVVFADINGDGFQDLLVSAMHKENVLYINDGNGTFVPQERSGLGPSKGSMTMTLADVEGDGDLDLYIANYKEYTIKDLYSTEELAWNNILKEPYNKLQQAGSYTLVPPFDKHYQIFRAQDSTFAGAAETGEKDELYINRGGIFEKVTDTRSVFLDEDGEPYGLQPDWGLTAKFQDLTGDGLPDLYVCNDFFTKDRVWINQGKGVFKAIAWQAIRNISFASMGVDFSDINRDGELDIFTTEMLSPEHSQRLRSASLEDPAPSRIGQIEARAMYNRNSMYLKRKDDTYAEISHLSNVEATGWSWDASFMDINLDGFEDLIVNTGYLHNVLDIDAQLEMMRKGRNIDEHFVELMLNSPLLDLPNKLLMNKGDLTFEDKSSKWGFNESDISHGMAIADLNNDGGLDIITNRMNQKACIYENTAKAPRIAVDLKGKSPNTGGIGAKIQLKGGSHNQEQEISAGGDYLSGSGTRAMFAAGEEDVEYSLVVIWPGGLISQVEDVRPNRIYEIDQSGAVAEEVKGGREIVDQQTVFKDVSFRIGHSHHETPFNDWELQPLLPARLSQLGPGMAWIDIDQDGDDDLFIAAGKGGTTGAFENLGDGTFRPLAGWPFNKTVPGDQTTILGWSAGQETRLLVGSANYEQGNPRVPSVYQYSNAEGKEFTQESILSNYSTTGPLAASDYDGDGDLDIFLGGRFVPAHYPRNASSKLFRNERGNFVLDKVNSGKLSEIGLVSAAVFTDYDRDGDRDLLLSREWDSIILMENINGVFNDVSERAGLAGYKGWWNGIATGDLNNDGLPDIVATNRGTNSSYQLTQRRPLRMYFDDFDRDGRVDIIEANAAKPGGYVPRHPLNKFRDLPIVTNRMRSYSQFAGITLQKIFADLLPRVPFKEINTLEHMLFLNTGTGFEAHPLPVEAQFSTAFYAGVADYDNDGNEDLFLSQNFFDFPKQLPRQDAGRGLWLKGDGMGGLSPVPGSKSGIKVYGEQRGASLGDFNRDGRVDLAVSQNGAETKLFMNRTAHEGVLITMDGPAVNRNGVGSSVRLVYGNGQKGPLREIQSGSGYWSQNSYTQVLGKAKRPVKIEIIWFDETVQAVDFSEDKRIYKVSYPKGG